MVLLKSSLRGLSPKFLPLMGHLWGGHFTCRGGWLGTWEELNETKIKLNKKNIIKNYNLVLRERMRKRKRKIIGIIGL